MIKRLKAELTVASLIVMAVLGVCLFWLFGSSYKNDIRAAAVRELSAVRAADTKGADSGKLDELFDNEYISKADAAAEMLRLDSTLLTDMQRLRETAAMLGFDEIHITDEGGVIWWGTEESCYGYELAGSDLTAPMLDILSDSGIKLACPTAENSFGNRLKYAAVARKDGSGIVMAGVYADRLPALEPTSVHNSDAEYLFGQNGFIFIINNESKSILSFPPDSSLTGSDAQQAGIPFELLTDGFEGSAVIGGDSYYCISKESGELLLCAAIPADELYGSRNEAVVIAAAMGLAVLFACRIMAGLDYKHNVIKRINAVGDMVKRAAEEDTALDEPPTAEFEGLYRSLNDTVFSLGNKLAAQDNEQLASVIGRARETADRQTEAAERFDRRLAEVFERIGECGRCADSAVKSAQKCERLALDGGAGMSGMMASFYNINELASQIRQVTMQLEELSETTGKLAFTAAIEASRAGENGQRFASIADQVRKLASKSAAAAGEIITLSRDLSEAAKSGGDEARYSVGNFGGLEDSSKSCVGSVKSLAEINRVQASAIRDCAALLSEMTESIESLKQLGTACEQEVISNEESGGEIFAPEKETQNEPLFDEEKPQPIKEAPPSQKSEPNSDIGERSGDALSESGQKTAESIAAENSKKLDSMVEALLAARAARKAAEAAAKENTVAFDDGVLKKDGEKSQKPDGIEQMVSEMLEELSHK